MKCLTCGNDIETVGHAWGCVDGMPYDRPATKSDIALLSKQIDRLAEILRAIQEKLNER